MKADFGVKYYSSLYNASLMFTSVGRTITRRELDELVAKHEPILVGRLPGHVEIIELGRLAPTDESTLPPTITSKEMPSE